MKARLNLTIDEDLLLNIKKIAMKNDTSISEMVTDYFEKISRPVQKKSFVDLVRKLEKPKTDPDADMKKIYYEDKAKKYGF